MKFRINDRIIGIKNIDDKPIIGIRGTVKDITIISGPPILVEFDENINGHEGNGFYISACKKGHAYFVDEENIELLPEKHIMVEEGCEKIMADKNFHVGDILEPVNLAIPNGCSFGTEEFGDGRAVFIKVIGMEGGQVKGKFLDAQKKETGFISCCWMKPECFRKVTSAKQNLMSKLNTLAKKLVDADIRKIAQAQFLDNCLNLTDEGKEAIFALWLQNPANKKALAEVAEEKIEEEKEEDCK